MTDSTHKSVDFSKFDREVDRLREEFEQSAKAGENPRIEDYLCKIADAGQEVLLLELILAEQKIRQNGGILPNVDEYRERFPDHQLLVEAVFAIAPLTSVDRHNPPLGRRRSASSGFNG